MANADINIDSLKLLEFVPVVHNSACTVDIAATVSITLYSGLLKNSLIGSLPTSLDLAQS